MSWAVRRRFMYLAGVTAFLTLVVVGPLAWWAYSSVPASCPPGTMRPGGAARGPCTVLDERALHPVTVLWTRSFRVRDGLYNAVAYVQNPNEHAGVRSVRYRFSLYDQRNILVTERTGTTFLMPGGITPIFEGAIATGERAASHAFFEFAESLIWERMSDVSGAIIIRDHQLTDAAASPRLTATVQNTAVTERTNVQFAAILFDPAGNAFTASQTALPRLSGGESAQVIFTWPDPIRLSVGRIEIIPRVAPASASP